MLARNHQKERGGKRKSSILSIGGETGGSLGKRGFIGSELLYVSRRRKKGKRWRFVMFVFSRERESEANKERRTKKGARASLQAR